MSEIVDNLRRIFQVLNEQSQRVRRSTGLTGPQLWTIKTISDSEPINVKDLARRIYLHPATVVGILDRLEESGLVLRIRSHEDRRVVTVALTEKGKQLVAGAPEVIQGVLISGLERLPARRRKIIDEGLAELVKMLGIETMPPQPILSPETNRIERKEGLPAVTGMGRVTKRKGAGEKDPAPTGVSGTGRA